MFKILLPFILTLNVCAGTYTPHYSLYKPATGDTNYVTPFANSMDNIDNAIWNISTAVANADLSSIPTTYVNITGDTMTGPLVINSSVTSYYGTFFNPVVSTAPTVLGTGGTTTTYTSNGVTWAVHRFTTSGTFTPPANLTQARVLVVGGGGAGGASGDYGNGGGGGAGQVYYSTTYTITGDAITVTVSTGAYSEQNANPSVFGNVTALGGGHGGTGDKVGINPTNGADGASGGGGANSYIRGPLSQGGTAYSLTTGYNGGIGTWENGGAAGGGGGAGHMGYPGVTPNYGGNGGAGVYNSITGASVPYGGGGGGHSPYGPRNGVGGLGGGGTNSAGTANTGGGGAGSGTSVGYAGGSGVVIVSYMLNVAPYFDVLIASGNAKVYGNLYVKGDTTLDGSLVAASSVTASDCISSGGSLNSTILSTGTINADLQGYKTTVQSSTATIYQLLQTTASALTSEISRATTRENAIAVSTGAIASSTGTIQSSLNSVIASTAPLKDYANWNTAYSWGNHASAGYITSTTSYLADGVSLALTGATFSAKASSVTLQGNTFNAANKLVQLDGTGKLPAVDGSALTGLTGANLSSTQTFTGQNTFNNLVTISSTAYVDGNLGVGTTKPVATFDASGSVVLGSHTFLVNRSNIQMVLDPGYGVRLTTSTTGKDFNIGLRAADGKWYFADYDTVSKGIFISPTNGDITLGNITSTTTIPGWIDIGRERIVTDVSGASTLAVAYCTTGKKATGGAGWCNNGATAALYSDLGDNYFTIGCASAPNNRAVVICARVSP